MLITSLILVVVGGMAAWVMHVQLRAAEASLDRKTISYARLAADELGTAVAFNDSETAREVFRALARDSDVRAIALYGNSGTLLASAGELQTSAVPATTSRATLNRTPSRVRVVLPVTPREGADGILIIELSTASVARARTEILHGCVAMGGVALLLGLIGASLIGRSLKRRLSSLADVATCVANGDVSCIPVQDASEDEVGQLTRAFEIMLERLNTMMADAAMQASEEQDRLDALVRARTEELAERSRGMRFLLDHLVQGVAIVDRDGHLGDERSRTLDLWFGPPQPNVLIWEYLRDHPVASRLEAGWTAITDDFLPLELALDQLPRAFAAGERHLSLQVDPVYETDGAVRRFLVFFNDVTAQRERAHADAAQREMAAVLVELTRDRAGFLSQMREMGHLIGQTLAASAVTAELKRELHTLKGNAAMLGFERLAQLCHEIETFVGETGETPSAELKARLRGVWDALRSPLDELMSDAEARVEVTRAELDATRVAVAAGEARAAILARLDAFTFELGESTLARLAGWARSAAARQGKCDLDVRTDASGLRFDPVTWGAFWGTYVHLVRNAVSHGIELPDIRARHGKARHGTLQLSCRVTVHQIIVDLQDDGAGIDWERVRARARAFGLPATTQGQLVAALFAEGLSTKESADELSGRGEGLSAVKASAEALGGTITVESGFAIGTLFRIAFPLAALASSISIIAAPHAAARRRSA